MKNLLLTLVTILILSCTKKQDDPKPVVTSKNRVRRLLQGRN